MSGSSVKAAMLLGAWWDVSVWLHASMIQDFFCKEAFLGLNPSEASILDNLT